MLKLVIWWIFFGIMTWVVETFALGVATRRKVNDNHDLHKRIGDLWINAYFRGICGYDVFGSLKRWQVICAYVSLIVAWLGAWPFDRVMMYIHWRKAVKQVIEEGS